MSNFRIKENKKKKSDVKSSTTLDKKHNDVVNRFNKKKESLDSLKKTIEKHQMELELLDKDRENFTPEKLNHRSFLLDEIERINEEILLINNNTQEMNYYDKAGDVIANYYKIRNTNIPKVSNSKNILEYLSKSKSNEPKDKNNISRSNLFETYCKRIDGVRINKDDGKNRIKYCSFCKVEKTLDYHQSAYICPSCGEMEEVIIDEDRQIKEYSPYKRINHFREWLNQFQAKESTDIPDIVYKSILVEINKMRITDLSKLNKNITRKILKKLEFNKYYEHIPYIINKLNNIPPPKISKQVEKVFINMFKQIQKPWELYKPKGRKNFLSYSYILHKFCELLDLDYLLDCFPLLKSHIKLMEQDEVWKKICNHLKWEFYSSFK